MLICSFPNTVSDDSLEPTLWKEFQLKYSVISCVHLKGTSIISIQYGDLRYG